VLCLAVLTPFWTNHGKITQDKLNANQVRMQAPWNQSTPIKALFTQLNVGIRFATAGNDAPSAASVIRIGYNIINATGLFDVACCEWRAKDDTDKSLSLFHHVFRDADQDCRYSTTTAASAGYQGANAATTVLAAPTTAATKPHHAPVSTTTTPSAAVATQRSPDLRPNTSYCWSRGFLKNQKHTSLTCKFEKDGQQDAATGTHQLGGATGIFTPRTTPNA
jgi:hypothetical protein